ncbi:MAG: hypothetical protein ACLSXN_04930 [Veillonella parvula]|uniref:hypothetical protein n=1 Tax=Veillonella parvula TaxID=29466 RepID=UPI0039965EC1
MKHKKLIAALLLTLFTTPLLTPLSIAKGSSSIRVSTPRVSSPVRSSTPKANTITNSTGKFFKSSNPTPTKSNSDSGSSFFTPFLTGYIIGDIINSKSDKEKADTQKEEPKLEAPKEEVKNPDGPGFFESIILWFKSLFE